MVDGGVTGVLLAAGAGRRAGGPKALRCDRDGSSWLQRSVRVLLDGGCAEVVVVLGAGAEQAGRIVAAMADTDPVRVVSASDWSTGVAASLRAGLAALGPAREAACVHLVDLPDVGPDVVATMITDARPETLARATYGGRPGHPVVIGRDHLRPLAAGLVGDEGGRAYLLEHGARRVECGLLATGADVDEAIDA